MKRVGGNRSLGLLVLLALVIGMASSAGAASYSNPSNEITADAEPGFYFPNAEVKLTDEWSGADGDICHWFFICIEEYGANTCPYTDQDNGGVGRWKADVCGEDVKIKKSSLSGFPDSVSSVWNFPNPSNFDQTWTGTYTTDGYQLHGYEFVGGYDPTVNCRWGDQGEMTIKDRDNNEVASGGSFTLKPKTVGKYLNFKAELNPAAPWDSTEKVKVLQLSDQPVGMSEDEVSAPGIVLVEQDLTNSDKYALNPGWGHPHQTQWRTFACYGSLESWRSGRRKREHWLGHG